MSRGDDFIGSINGSIVIVVVMVNEVMMPVVVVDGCSFWSLVI